MLAATPGCLPSSQHTGPSIDQLVRSRDSVHTDRNSARASSPTYLADKGDPIIATINGAVLSKTTVVDLLVRSHGVGVLEQLIGLETARALAQSKGVAITDEEVEREYELALRRLVDPLAPITSATFDKEAAEKLLDTILAERNVSREEFAVILQRNAFLRKIVYQGQVFSDAELQGEYDRAYGKRVVARHIQLGSPGDVARVQERLAAGEDFGELAARYSANTASGKRGGLLEPFSATDDELPEAFRLAAFALEPGQVSVPVRIGAWEHLIKIDRFLEPESRDFATVRDELIERLRERVTDEQMRRLHEKLFRGSSIEIAEPSLRDAFFTRYPELRRPAGR